MPQFELAQAGTEQKAEDSADKFREQIIALLPGLSAFAYCLTGNAEQPDDLVEETCARALADKGQWQPGTDLDNWVFRIAQNLWFNRQRAKKFRSEPMGSEVADHPEPTPRDGDTQTGPGSACAPRCCRRSDRVQGNPTLETARIPPHSLT